MFDGHLKHFRLMVVFVNKVCDFNRIKFTEKEAYRIEFKFLSLRVLCYLITIFLVVFAGVCCKPEQAEAYHGHLAAEPGQVDRFPIKVSQR